MARPESAKGVFEPRADSATPFEDSGRGAHSGRYAADAPDIPTAAQAPGAGARVKAIDPARLAAAILKACERRRPELVLPAKARLLFAVAQLSAACGDWLLTRSTSRPPAD
jgi:hypothetical protein